MIKNGLALKIGYQKFTRKFGFMVKMVSPLAVIVSSGESLIGLMYTAMGTGWAIPAFMALPFGCQLINQNRPSYTRKGEVMLKSKESENTKSLFGKPVIQSGKLPKVKPPILKDWSEWKGGGYIIKVRTEKELHEE